MTIKLIEDKEVWDYFIDQSPYGLLFHKWNFLKIIEKHTNYKLLPYGIYQGDKLICVFPLFFKKYHGLKMVCSPPLNSGVPYLGFVMNQEFDILKQYKKDNYLNIVADEINEEIKKMSPNYVSISLVSNFLDIRPFKWTNYGFEIYFSNIINLNCPLDEIWKGFRKDLAKEIKKVDGNSTKLSISSDISMFYDLEKKIYIEKDLYFPIVSKNYLEDLLGAYPENLKLISLHDGNEESIRLTCEYKDRFILWLGGAKPQKNKYINECLVWEVIKLAKNAGYKKCDWGGGTKAISQFKSKFNPTFEIHFAIYKKDNLGKFAEWIYLNCAKRLNFINRRTKL